jgi:Domain of unknown function (DUF1998)
MKIKGQAKPHGEVRQSQLITTFGPGSMLDLPRHSVLVSGLDYWSPGDSISEPRLSQKVARALNVPAVELRSPPAADDDPLAPKTGVTVFQFPEWFITQDLEDDGNRPGSRTRLLVHRTAAPKGVYKDANKKSRTVVPIRFVRACRAGHIGDIDWYAFVHSGPSDCAAQQRQLYVDERGTSGDLSEVWIRCDCKVERSMVQAALLQNQALGCCDGARPWLGPFSKESCGEPNRLLIRSASNAYFSQLVSVISLPERDEVVQRAVDSVWENLEAAETIDDLRYERKKAKVKSALESLSDEEVFAEIQTRRGGPKIEKSVKQAELETLIAAQAELGDDRPEGVFYARALPRNFWDEPWMAAVERVILVQRLREVVAQVGFTRFESAAPDIEGELDMGVRRASIGRDVNWLPAFENKGEGIFLQFEDSKISNWLGRQEVGKRSVELMLGFDSWRKERPGSTRKFPGPAYIMLHSLSHLLITAVSLECGYPASSIRERIYAIPGVGFGVLLYTASTDAEGTLGGLVQAGRRIGEMVRTALELGQLCSNDPVCAQHDPPNGLERRYLHGAACHGCLLIAETSCEQQNDFLDRALVTPTVQNQQAEFFQAPYASAVATGGI